MLVDSVDSRVVAWLCEWGDGVMGWASPPRAPRAATTMRGVDSRYPLPPPPRFTCPCDHR